MQDDLKVAEKFNSSFEDAILSVGINEPIDCISNTINTCDAVDAILLNIPLIQA